MKSKINNKKNLCDDKIFKIVQNSKVDNYAIFSMTNNAYIKKIYAGYMHEIWYTSDKGKKPRSISNDEYVVGIHTLRQRAVHTGCRKMTYITRHDKDPSKVGSKFIVKIQG